MRSLHANHTSPAPAAALYPGYNNHLATAYGASGLDSDYARIRPLIPERTSSNPEQISRIVNRLNYDVSNIRPMYIRPSNSQELGGRQPRVTLGATSAPAVNGQGAAAPPPPIVPGPSVCVSVGGGTNGANDWAHSPISPQSSTSDAKGGWKLTGKRVQQFQVGCSFLMVTDHAHLNALWSRNNSINHWYQNHILLMLLGIEHILIIKTIRSINLGAYRRLVINASRSPRISRNFTASMSPMCMILS